MKWKESRKYRLLDEWKEIRGQRAYRIQAIRDFGAVKAGDVGGYVHSERNLAHDGFCWIYEEAASVENSVVFGNAMLYAHAKACDYARIHGSAILKGRAGIIEYGEAYENAALDIEAVIAGEAKAFGFARLSGMAVVTGRSRIYGESAIRGEAFISGAEVSGNAIIEDKAVAWEHTKVCGYSYIAGNTELLPGSIVYGTREKPAFINREGKAVVLDGAGLFQAQDRPGHGAFKEKCLKAKRLGR